MKVTLCGLTKSFLNKKTKANVVAVNDINLEFPDGKLCGLLGPSGCGKSTTLYMISGLEKPTSGKILFGEDDVTRISPEKRGIGFVFQNYALYPHMTVLDNITFPLINQKWKKPDAIKRAYEVASLVQIETLLDRKPAELSGGQQQRVAIARAIARTPRVLLLDEPLSNLDARLRLQTREEIKRIQTETNVTTIFVTHDQEEAMSICDFVVVMKLGMVQQTGAPQEIFDNPNNLFVAKFLGTPPINVFNGVIKDHKVYIGDEVVKEIEAEDQDCYVAIRPEAFTPSKEGQLTLDLSSIEVMGRDKLLIMNHPALVNAPARILIDSDIAITEQVMKFALRDSKVFVFNKDEERIY